MIRRGYVNDNILRRQSQQLKLQIHKDTDGMIMTVLSCVYIHTLTMEMEWK